jgi:endonuclease/exonuclease/phosphatase family metal-dependent hydrolase
MDINPQVLNWNIRGANDPAKRSAIREFVSTLHVNIVCFQETKLDVIDDFTVLQSLGPSFDEYMYLPAVQTRGGILLAWDTSVIELENFSFDTYAITAEVKTRDNNRWWISTVYGPQDTADKINFLREISERRALCPGPWMIIGDFNMILYASEKNNENLDRRMMARFRRFVQEQELKDLYMHGRVYTWSNEREIPTMTRIDRALVSVDWDLQNPDALLQAMSSSISDHAPLHLSLSVAFRPKQRFKFELFWLNLEGIDEAIKEAWKCDDRITEPFRRLDALFRNAAVLGTEEIFF